MDNKDKHLTTNAADLAQELAPLYHRFQGQENPQRAYIEIYPQGRTMIAEYDGEIGNAVPMAVYHGRILRVRVSPYLRGDVLADILEGDEVQDLAQRICAGNEAYWDGANMRGRLNDDGKVALEALQECLDSYQEEPYLVQVCDPGDWVATANQVGITGKTTDDEIHRLALALLDEASADNVLIDGDLEAHLRWLRDNVREAM